MKNIFALLLFAVSFQAIAQSKPVAPTKFWTPERKVEIIVLAGESSYDGWTTQHLRHYGYTEINPVARPFVSAGYPGQVAATIASCGATFGAEYIAHKMHHDKIANWIGRIVVVGEGANIGRQTALVINP